MPGRRATSCPRTGLAVPVCNRPPSLDSSESRSHGWARTTARRHSTMSPGRTWAMRAFPIASRGTRPRPRSIRTTTSRASDSTALQPAVRTPWAVLYSILNSTRSRTQTPAVTTTGWTRSGGTSSGWDGPSDRTTEAPPTPCTPVAEGPTDARDPRVRHQRRSTHRVIRSSMR